MGSKVMRSQLGSASDSMTALSRAPASLPGTLPGFTTKTGTRTGSARREGDTGQPSPLPRAGHSLPDIKP